MVPLAHTSHPPNGISVDSAVYKLHIADHYVTYSFGTSSLSCPCCPVDSVRCDATQQNV